MEQTKSVAQLARDRAERALAVANQADREASEILARTSCSDQQYLEARADADWHVTNATKLASIAHDLEVKEAGQPCRERAASTAVAQAPRSSCSGRKEPTTKRPAATALPVAYGADVAAKLVERQMEAEGERHRCQAHTPDSDAEERQSEARGVWDRLAHKGWE